MKKLNKSKLNQMTKSFTKGVKITLNDKTSIALAGLNGGLRSEGSFTKGIYEGAKALAMGAVANGVGHIVIDELFGTDEELELTED